MFAFVLALSMALLPPGETAEPPLAGETLKVPVSVKAMPGRLCVIRAETNCKRAVWIIPTTIEADANDGGLKLTVVAPKGQYTLYCVVSPGVDQVVIAKVTLDVGEAAPPPPDKPPDNPPPPPAPVHPFITELISLFPSPATALLKGRARLIASVYRLAAKEAMSSDNVTLGELIELITAAFAQIEDTSRPLNVIRTRVKAELVRVMPNLEADLSPATRAIVADVYARAATALEACAK